MGRRQVITIDVTFRDNYGDITTKEIIAVLANKNVKNLSIKNVNKRKEK